MTGIIITGVPADDPVNRAHADVVGYPPDMPWPPPYKDSVVMDCYLCGGRCHVGPELQRTPDDLAEEAVRRAYGGRPDLITGRTYLERGEPVVVLIRWGPGGGPRNVLVERADGSRVVRPFRGLRRPR